MPKIARDYYYDRYTSATYSVPDLKVLNNHNIYNRKVKKKKKNFFKFFVSSFVLICFVFGILGFSFKDFTKAVFYPNPYKSIRIDYYSFALPTSNYLSNSWSFGRRSFRYQANKVKAQMVSITENNELTGLENEIKYLMTQFPQIEPSVYVWNYDNGNFADINASKVYSTASIIKIPVLIELFKSIEAGQISLDEKIPLTEYFRSEGSGSLQFKAQNSEWTIDELANLMITESDNSATNMIMAKVGSMTDVNQAIRDWGLKNTEVHAWLPDLDGYNHSSARELAQMLYNIDTNEEFLSENSRNHMLNYMGHVHNNRLIHAGLPDGSIFLHKTGDIGKMLGDAGIVITPNGSKYIVVILANRPHNSFAGKEFIVKASEIIYNYMVK